jgi:protein disulfide-isomerase A6
VDCDDDANKQLCAAQGVQGFPTLKTFRPGRKPGSKPIVEDYRGPRTASGIRDAVMDKINNHVVKLTDADADAFFEAAGPKAVLFTEKGTTSALIRAVAIEFLDVIKVGQARNKEAKIVEKFGIDSFPTLVLIPEGDDAAPIIYDGELNKNDIVDFLSQAGEPNSRTHGSGKKTEKKPASSTKSAEPEAKSPEPEESPEPPTADATADAAPPLVPIRRVQSLGEMAPTCFQPKSGTCVMAIIPPGESERGDLVTTSLSKLFTKYIHANRHLFPIFAIGKDAQDSLLEKLQLTGDIELIAINNKHRWWRHYEGDYSAEGVEAWVDAIRLGDAIKLKLPDGLEIKFVEETPVEDAPAEESSSEATQATDPEPEEETEAPEVVDDDEIVHGEL